MSNKVNAKNKLDFEALKRRHDGGQELLPDTLTESEKVQMALMLERLSTLEKQLAQIRQATADLITSIVRARGLDPAKYGVNLAAGRILPVGSVSPSAGSGPDGSGEKEKGGQ